MAESSIAPVTIVFECQGVAAMKVVFDSVEARMVQFDRTTTRSAQGASRERVRGTRTEVDQREKEYGKLVKQAEKWERQAVKDADKASAQKVRMAHKYLLQEVRDGERADLDKIRSADAAARKMTQIAESQMRAETSLRRRYGRAMGRGAIQGASSFIGTATSMIGLAAAAGGGFALADMTRKEMSFQGAVVQASNMSYIPGTTTREQVSPAVIEAMSRGAQGLTNIDKSDVAAGIKKYVGLSSDFEGLHGKTSSGRSGLDELAILSKASGTSFDTLMEAAASVKASNKDMTSDSLITMMRGILGAGKQGTIPLEQLAANVGMVQSTASIYSGDQTKNQSNLLGLVQLAGRSTGGDAARAAMAVKDFSSDIVREGLKPGHGMTRSMVYKGGNEKAGLLSPDQLIANVFKATGGGFSKVQEMLGQRSMPIFEALKPIFDAAESAKKGTGVAAVQTAVQGFENVSYTPEDTMKEFAAVMKTDGESIDRSFKHIGEVLEKDVIKYLDAFARGLEQNMGTIQSFLSGLSDIAKFMMEHPWISLFDILGAKMILGATEAFASKAFQQAMADAMAGGVSGAVKGATGAGAGGGIGGAAGLGGLVLPAALILSVAALTITATTAIIDAKDTQDKKRQNREAIELARSGTILGKIQAGTATPAEIKEGENMQAVLQRKVKGGTEFSAHAELAEFLNVFGESAGRDTRKNEQDNNTKSLNELTIALRELHSKLPSPGGADGGWAANFAIPNKKINLPVQEINGSASSGAPSSSPERGGQGWTPKR